MNKLIDDTLPWSIDVNVPWKSFKNVHEQIATLPTFLVGEFLFFTLTVFCFFHAVRNGRVFIFVWFTAVLAGTANDMFFMALPQVDNFWQAQACFMLTPRLPLYIPCVYICFMYFAVVTAWHMFRHRSTLLGFIGECCFAGLLGELFYAPYDIIGAKFLWWTWHDQHPPIAERLLGVPVGSSMWVITFVSVFSALLRLTLGRVQVTKQNGKNHPITRQPSFSRCVFAMFVSVALSTLLMMVLMGPFNAINGGLPNRTTLILCVVVYLSLTLIGMIFERRHSQTQPNTWMASHHATSLLTLGVSIYYVTLVAIMALGVPEQHISTGLHQKIGYDKTLTATDVMGNVHLDLLDPNDFDEDYHFQCATTQLEQGTEWYTICGKAHSNRQLYLVVVAILGWLGLLIYHWALGRYDQKKKQKQK